MKAIRAILIILCCLPLGMAASEPTDASPKLIHTQWYSHDEHLYRFVDIYVPAAYVAMQNDASSEGYCPVLYLLHGLGGYEASWQEMAGAIDTLDALIASGRCKPMILVMPDCNRWPVTGRPSYHNRTIWTCMLRYPALIREHEVEHALSDLIDMIDSTFCVSSCAVAGLSDGARMAINIANMRPDRIQEVAVFSPVWHEDQQPLYPEQTYSLYVGQKDFFYPYGERFNRLLNRRNHPHHWIVLPESHDWDMWCLCISHFLQYLGKNE